MASLIPGYEYDIFVSYRQKDNKYDGWVTEFVDNLKKELESTFKEEISVFFDINPHDGLLETHDVDASLKEKLKCLIFIPIISRTYCDPNSFAWENEFKAFVDFASHDQFGLKVKLPNGNIANRVLPVRIHDLDNGDIILCESILGGVLRGIEFIYKEAGVNRSLSPKDSEERNINNTNYRNQINKVALAIKEIIVGIQTGKSVKINEGQIYNGIAEFSSKPKTKLLKGKFPILRKSKLIKSSIILVGLIILVYFTFNIISLFTYSDGRISIAVMPFQNMTNDINWDRWQVGIQDILITSLSNSEELKVCQKDAVNSLIQSKGKIDFSLLSPSNTRTISRKVGAYIFIYGSINSGQGDNRHQSEDGRIYWTPTTLRINAQLIYSRSGRIDKTFQLDGNSVAILPTIDSLSYLIKDYLLISKLKEEVPVNYLKLATTTSPEAYSYFIKGLSAYYRSDYPSAVNLYSRAIEIDSTFTFAVLELSFAYKAMNMYDQAKKFCLMAYKKRDLMSMEQRIWLDFVYAYIFETPNEVIKYLKQLQEFSNHYNYYDIGVNYCYMQQYEKAIPEFEKWFKMIKEFHSKPKWVNEYTNFGIAYHRTGQYTKEKQLYMKAEKDFPDDTSLISRQAILALCERDTILANKYIKRYKVIRSNHSDTEATILTGLANIYKEANFLDKAEQYYREALSYQPENPLRINNLAYFLIDKNCNINEGLELAAKAQLLDSNDFSSLHCKGLGLYKLGKFEGALKLLEKGWSLRGEYDHEFYLHLEEVKKAVVNQRK